VRGLAGDSTGDTPEPELAQRVYRLEERLDRLVAHLVGSLGMSIDERKQL
jgi:phosphate uptake regulator